MTKVLCVERLGPGRGDGSLMDAPAASPHRLQVRHRGSLYSQHCSIRSAVPAVSLTPSTGWGGMGVEWMGRGWTLFLDIIDIITRGVQYMWIVTSGHCQVHVSILGKCEL